MSLAIPDERCRVSRQQNDHLLVHIRPTNRFIPCARPRHLINLGESARKINESMQREGTESRWTLTYSMYANMGGFVIQFPSPASSPPVDDGQGKGPVSKMAALLICQTDTIETAEIAKEAMVRIKKEVFHVGNCF